MISFRQVNKKSFSIDADLKVTPDQERFAGGNLADYVRICRDDDKHFCFLICDGELPIGFFALDFQEDRHRAYTQGDSHFCILRNFFIDQHWQGKGLASKSLQLLPDFIRQHFPQIKKIYLTVNEKNPAAQNVYLKHGFTALTLRYMGGSAGPQVVMVLEL